jgi:hypothetical protein
MKNYLRVLPVIIFVLMMSSVMMAQNSDITETSSANTIARVAAPVPQDNDNPYRLRNGDNEFGFWGGFSPAATTIFAGLHEDEAEDRKFFIGAFRYGRTLVANDILALQYTGGRRDWHYSRALDSWRCHDVQSRKQLTVVE